MAKKRHGTKGDSSGSERVPKSLSERRIELSGALDNLRRSILTFSQSRQIHHLAYVALVLRAIVYYKAGSGSFRHPLLLDLAAEQNCPLRVYVSRMAILRDRDMSALNLPAPIFAIGQNMFSVEETPAHAATDLSEALRLPYVIVGGKKLSMNEIIAMVADTEVTHYDPDRPKDLDMLNRIEIFGVPGAYQALIELGEVVYTLGIKFLGNSG